MMRRLRSFYETVQTVFLWTVAGFFAFGGILSSMLHEYNNALAYFGIATVILLVIALRGQKR